MESHIKPAVKTRYMTIPFLLLQLLNTTLAINGKAVLETRKKINPQKDLQSITFFKMSTAVTLFIQISEIFLGRLTASISELQIRTRPTNDLWHKLQNSAV
jgi:hypothetical protein